VDGDEHNNKGSFVYFHICAHHVSNATSDLQRSSKLYGPKWHNLTSSG
jgi:hypothetical protein